MVYAIMRSRRVLINTDPQRRCYNGVHFSSALVDTEWERFDDEPTLEKAEQRLKFWTDLNDYAVSQRGESARVRYKIEEMP